MLKGFGHCCVCERHTPLLPSTASPSRTSTATPRHSGQNWTGCCIISPWSTPSLCWVGRSSTTCHLAVTTAGWKIDCCLFQSNQAVLICFAVSLYAAFTVSSPQFCNESLFCEIDVCWLFFFFFFQFRSMICYIWKNIAYWQVARFFGDGILLLVAYGLLHTNTTITQKRGTPQ